MGTKYVLMHFLSILPSRCHIYTHFASLGKYVSHSHDTGGYLGCSTDVMDIMDAACSGKQKCEVTPSVSMGDRNPCFAELSSYMDASYECVPGEWVFVTISLLICT